MQLSLTINVWVTFQDPIDPNGGGKPGTDWFMSIGYIFKSMDDMVVKYSSQYSWNGDVVIYTAAGFSESALGLNTSFTLKQTPLQTNQGEPQQYVQEAVPVSQ